MEHPYKTTWYRIMTLGVEPLEALTKPLKRIYTFCINGHNMIGDNLYIRPKTKQRICRACTKERKLRFKSRRMQNV